MCQLLRKPCVAALCTVYLGVCSPALARAGDGAWPVAGAEGIRVAAAQPKDRTISYRLTPAEALAQVDSDLGALEALVEKAAAAGCNALALPEDTLGLLRWEAGNPTRMKDVLPEAEKRMLDRLGKAAAKHRMYLVCCSDTVDPDGATHNTAFLLGRDGKEIGRYHKVNLPLAEQGRTRGDKFPVFPTTDLGNVGMLICYDMIFPEAPRCLALQGADVIFHPTLGGAAIGDEDVSRAAFRTRAVDNFVWVIVAQRGRGSMIISPQGKIIAEAKGEDGLAIADIIPSGGRQGGDAFNTQPDMRGRLFRERVPAAYGILTDPNPPVLARVKSNVTKDEAIRIMAVGLTTGEERFKEAEALARAGKTDEAIRLFEKLCSECRTSWIDRAGRERIRSLRGKDSPSPAAESHNTGEQSPGKEKSTDDPAAWRALQPFLQPPAKYEGKLGDLRPVLKFDDGTPVQSPLDWPRRRNEIVQYWHRQMGAWPAAVERPQIKYLDREHVKNFTRHKVEVEMAPGRLVGPQYLLVPDGDGPFPAVLVTWYNSADSAGLNPKHRDTLDFGSQLAQRGFVALCIGGVGPEYGRAADGKSGVQPLSYLAYIAANCRNVLASLTQVDPRRIGIIGHSFGGKWAMFASCLEEKFACAVWVDPGIVWNEKDPNANYWDRWYLGYEFQRPSEQQRREGPVSSDHPRTGAYQRLIDDGRNLHELHALMAPRPFLVSGGAQDRPEHWTALNHTIELNRFLGQTGRVGMTMRDGHTPTAESNRQAFAFLEHHLSPRAAGPLRIHPTNPRYFTDGTRNPDDSLRAVYLTGSHTWNNLVDIGPGDPRQAFNFEGYLDFLDRHGHNFIRLWAWDSTQWDLRSSQAWTDQKQVLEAGPQPWRRTGPGKALDGKPKFDLDQFDPAYFDRLRARVRAAGERGIYVSVMLFEGWTLFHGRHASPAPDNWSLRSHPFHRDNNVQGIGDADGLARTLEVHTLKHKAINDRQAAYIRKVVDTLSDLDNVLYEVINEGGDKDWNRWVVKIIRDQERTKSKQHPVGITGHGAERLASMLASPADWISPGRQDGYAESPPVWNEKKVSLLDTDHIWGVGGDASWVWKSFLRGHNPLFMDPYDHRILGKGKPSQWDALRQALGATRRLANRIDLAKLTPSSDVASTKYCLADPGREYVVYSPAKGGFTVNLVAGQYAFEWFNPTTGRVESSGTVAAAGGQQIFTAPFAGSSVLYLVRPAAAPRTPRSQGGITGDPITIDHGALLERVVAVEPESPVAFGEKVADSPPPGIADRYPGDVGIEKDPRVIFAENFEAKDLAAVTKRWETVSEPNGLSLVGNVPAASSGKQSLLVTHTGGKGTGGQLYRRLKPGYDKLFARFYVKFDPDCAPIHHFGTHLGGFNPSTPWPQGGAGQRPNGKERFSIGVEPFGKDWVWDFYAYWCEMRGSPPKGQTWGNTFIRDPKLKVERGKWVCVEFMVRMNDVGDSNGELALWIDGKPVGHLGKGFPKGKWVFDKFTPGDGGGEGVRWDDARRGPAYFPVPADGTPFDGFRWRTAKELSLNYLWLYAYITRAAEGHVSRIWFDDVVVATEYIGPLREKKAPEAPVAAAQPPGIAAGYSGDEGIEKDPRVLYADDFETGTIKEIVTRWGNGHVDGRVTVSDEVRDAAPGDRSIRIKFGHLYTHFKPADQVHVRYYMRVHSKFGYPHHFPFLIADRVPTPWPKGFAGKKPAGDMFFGTAFDAWSDWGKLPPPGKWMLYSYWQDMKPDGRGKYWGNNLVPPQQDQWERGRWYCMEMMIKANSRPDAADGEQKFWIDGKLVGDFKGFRFRSTDKLKLNSFWLLHDGETGSSINKDPDHARREYDVWFDDLVIATEYIGPIQGKPKGGKKVGVPGRSALGTPGLVLAKPGKVVFQDDLDGESSRFKGGRRVAGGVKDSKALEFSRSGVDVFSAFSTPVQDSTTIRFKLKPLAEVTGAQVLVWSAKLKDNVRIHLPALKKGEWKEIEIRALDLRVGWDGEGGGIEGEPLDNFKIIFDGPPEARVLLDDVEVRE